MDVSGKPIIGITSTIKKHKNIPSVDVNEKYIHAIIQGGGVPIVIPIGSKNMVNTWISICDGIMLTGGEDVDPSTYHEQPYPQIRKTNRKRDDLEIELIQSAQKKQLPILAICRGMSILNVTFGGTIFQDINTNIGNPINHEQQAERAEPTHEVEIDLNSRLYQIVSRTNIRVNSMHHQAINMLAPSLKIVATTSDGVIEAVEGVNGQPFILGVQWHPEELASEDATMVNLFKTFIGECSKSTLS